MRFQITALTVALLCASWLTVRAADEKPADAKAAALVHWLKQQIKPNGTWSSERVIIFTEYRATQNWLQTILVAHGLAGGDRLLTLNGDQRIAVANIPWYLKS